MLCSRCECSFYLARSLLSYLTTLLSGCMIGLVIGSVVMRYQMSLLEWEHHLITDEMDLYRRMENDCQVDLIDQSENLNKSEQIKQLNREKESILLEIDIIKQLKVNLQFKITQKQNGVRFNPVNGVMLGPGWTHEVAFSDRVNIRSFLELTRPKVCRCDRVSMEMLSMLVFW